MLKQHHYQVDKKKRTTNIIESKKVVETKGKKFSYTGIFHLPPPLK